MSEILLKQALSNHSKTAASGLGTIVGNCAQQFSDSVTRYWLLFSDLDNNQHESISIPFFGHGIAQRSDTPNILCVFEKRGKGACEIDLESLSVTRMIRTLQDRQFYGHGCYLDDQDVLLAAETNIANKHEGLLVVRDKTSLQELDAFPTFGSRPHDVHLLSDKKTLMVTNGGGIYGEPEYGSVVFIDVATRSLIEKYEIASPTINAGHVAIAENGNIVSVSAPRDGISLNKPVGGITIGGKTRPFARAAAPTLLTKRLKGETLSVCIEHKRELAFTTTPDANLVLAWDCNSGSLIKKIPMEMPKGICISQDKKYAIVSNIKTGPGLEFINLETLKIEPNMRVSVPFTGSHLFQLR